MPFNKKGPRLTGGHKPGMNPGTTIIRKDHIMATLTESADKLRSSLPKSGGGKAPQDSGIRLATFPRPEGELRFTWNIYEGKPYLRFQLWSKGDDGSFWPVKGQGFTIKVKDLPDLAEGVQKALDMALEATARSPEGRPPGGQKPSYRSSEGVEAPF